MAETRTGAPDNLSQGEAQRPEDRRIPPSDDRGPERKGEGSQPDRREDQAASREQSRPVDPDSAESDVDRDDTIDEP